VKKYLQIIKITFQEYFEYRLNFILWRFRNLISLFVLLSFWLALFGEKTDFLDYSKSQILTYVLGISLLKSIVIASRSIDLGGQIKSGYLTKLLIQPINLFKFWFSRDLADKLMNIFFMIFEIFLVIKIFNLNLLFPKDPATYFVFFILVFLATGLYFYLSFLLSFLAFWTDEIWATRFLFGFIFLEFFSGSLFPIDILPGVLKKIAFCSPFPYLIYYPLKFWLGQISFKSVFWVILMEIFWLILFKKLALYFWEKGSKDYGAYGG